MAIKRVEKSIDFSFSMIVIGLFLSDTKVIQKSVTIELTCRVLSLF